MLLSLLVLIPIGVFALAAAMANRAIDGDLSDRIDDWYLSGRKGHPVLPAESGSGVSADLSKPVEGRFTSAGSNI